jgi:hypothetical protein
VAKFIILLALIFFGMIAQFAADRDPSKEELSWAMIIPKDWREIQKTNKKTVFNTSKKDIDYPIIQ